MNLRDPAVIAAAIGLFGTVLTIVTARIPVEVEKRIKGLLNGRKSRALEEIDRLYQERQRRGLPLRRKIDHIIEEERPGE